METYSETRPAALRGVGPWVSRATTEDAQPGEPADSCHISRSDACAAATVRIYEYYGRSVRSFLFRTAVLFFYPSLRSPIIFTWYPKGTLYSF